MADPAFTQPYIPNTDDDRAEMLRAIGVGSVDDLFADIPAAHRDPALSLSAPLSEMEVRAESSTAWPRSEMRRSPRQPPRRSSP